MLNIRHLLLALVVSALLAGCITTRVLTGNSRSITYKGVVWDSDLTEAYRLAGLHCSSYGRKAALNDTDSEKYTATFLCVE